MSAPTVPVAPPPGGPSLGFPGRDSRPAGWPRRRLAPSFAPHGMVSSGHPLVTSAGLDVLRRGGNATDAAVSAGLVASVVMPEMCGLGGDLFALVGRAGDDVWSVQGSGFAPRGSTLEQVREAGGGTGMPDRGPLSVTVPGMVHGYASVLDRFGTRTFGELTEPAIDYAYGHPVSPTRIFYVNKFAELLRSHPDSAAVFLPGGEAPRPGDMFRQPDLARTLEVLAREGPGAFYEGDVAERMCRALADAGGCLTPRDLADHETDVSAPLSTTYRDHTVYQTCLPSQGLIVLEALNILDRCDLPYAGAGTPDGIHLLVEAIKLAFADRHVSCGDPAYGPSPVERLLSKDWASARSRQIGERAMTVPPEPTEPLDTGDTTYLCVVDNDGMMVSFIQSVAANFGSGIVAGDTGIVLNNRASQFSVDPASPNVFAPGKKPVHTLNCYLVADPSGRPVLVGGTPGGDRQPQWNTQIITGLIDDGRDVQQAIEQPLWINSPTSASARDYTLTLEDRAGGSVRDELVRRGHDVTLCGGWDIDSAAQVIARDPESGALCGGSDPRTEGAILGY